MYPEGDVGELADSVIRRGRLVALRLDELAKSGGDYPKQEWWNAVSGEYKTARTDADSLVRAVHTL
jgi:hypothetical protein